MTAYLKAVDTAKPADTDRTAYARLPEDEDDPGPFLRMPEGDEYTGAAARVLINTIASDSQASIERIDREDFPFEREQGEE